jgi:uracil-DNA glycosylase
MLAWHQAMGVDAALDAEPTNWLDGRAPGAGFALSGSPEPAALPAPPPQAARPAAQPPSAHSTPTTPPAALRSVAGPLVPSTPIAPPARRFTATAPDAAETSARAAARRAGSLDELRAALEQFDGCGLKATAKTLCLYRGAPRADLLIIGEAPGRDEDLEGKPFVGRAGQLLDRMLAAIGLGEEHVHITNIVYWRPPGNRTPTPQEAQVCRPFLERQIELVAPRIVLLLGGSATKAILDTPEGIMKIRGRWFDAAIGNQTVKTMASLHPAYLLRTPAAKRQAWRDLLTVKAALSATG